jgi:FMN phosphatase YigB (HAD superfamily)
VKYQSPTSDVANVTSCLISSPENLVTLTLLLDLDDTLLGNDMGSFIPAYLNALGKHLSNKVPPERMVPVLLAATQRMLENDQPNRTLKQVFDANFYPVLGIDQPATEEQIETFYAEVFPNLRSLTQFRPQAVELVEAALARGYQIGIATNPLFPLTAITQRLAWAGLPAEKYPLCLIPSLETFHFAKPNPAYFAEFLGRIGWPSGPVVMIGNDPDHDIRGALGLELPAFWITEGESPIPPGFPTPNAQGGLNDVLPWLDSLDLEKLQPVFNKPDSLVKILLSTPAALSSLTGEMPIHAWSQRPEPGEWGLNEIACHLRDVEIEVNLPRIKLMIDESNPFIPGWDTDRWAEERHYQTQDGPRALSDFTAARLESLGYLDGLGVDGWERPARHAIFGPTDLKEMVSIIAGHDRLHITQAHEVIQAIS